MANSGSSSNSSSGSTSGSSSSSNSSTSSTNTSNTSSNDTNTSNSSSDTSTQDTGSSSESDSNASESSSGSSSSGSTTGPFNNDQTSNQQGHQKFTKSDQHNNTNNSNGSTDSTGYNPGKPKVGGSEQAKLKDDVNNGVHKFSRLESLKYNNPVSGAVRGVKNGVDGVKNSVNTMKNFAKQKGLKNKLNFLRHSKHGQKIEQKLFKIVKFIIKFRHVGLIGVLVIALFNFSLAIIGSLRSYGETLHYYCPVGKDIDPGLVKSALYQQYCSNLVPSNIGIGFEELNGHYLVQTGSGPCTMTARANLWIRFFAKNNVSIYDYLFNETGDCEIKGVNGHMNNHSPSDVTDETFMRAFYDHDGSISGFTNKEEGVVTALKENGLYQSGKTINATMGYIRSEDLYEEYTNSKSSENWVFYLPTVYIGNMGPTAADGAYMEINGVRGTLRNVDLKSIRYSSASGKEKIIELLKEHPCGVICRVGPDKHGTGSHSCTITGYDEKEKKFLVVDPAAYCSGGFEVLQDSPNGIWRGPDSTAYWLSDDHWNVPFVTYIEEDTN